jgi:hypothetical protein
VLGLHDGECVSASNPCREVVGAELIRLFGDEPGWQPKRVSRHGVELSGESAAEGTRKLLPVGLHPHEQDGPGAVEQRGGNPRVGVGGCHRGGRLLLGLAHRARYAEVLLNEVLRNLRRRQRDGALLGGQLGQLRALLVADA